MRFIAQTAAALGRGANVKFLFRKTEQRQFLNIPP